MRKIHFGLIILIIVAALVFTGQMEPPSSAAGHAALNEAMLATGAAVQELTINSWTKLPAADLSDEQLGRMVSEAMGKLGVASDGYNLRHVKSERHRMARAEVIGDRLHIVVMAQVLYPRWEQKAAEAYLVINVETAATEQAVTEWHKRVGQVSGDMGGPVRTSTCLVGWLDGKLDKDSWLSRLSDAGKVLNSTIIDTIVQQNFVSITGFSPALPEWIEIGDKRININMVMRYSPYDDRTYVIIGSPLITGEY